MTTGWGPVAVFEASSLHVLLLVLGCFLTALRAEPVTAPSECWRRTRRLRWQSRRGVESTAALVSAVCRAVPCKANDMSNWLHIASSSASTADTLGVSRSDSSVEVPSASLVLLLVSNSRSLSGLCCSDSRRCRDLATPLLDCSSCSWCSRCACRSSFSSFCCWGCCSGGRFI